MAAAVCSSSSSNTFQQQCVQAIDYAANHFLHDQAVFFADILLAEAPSEEALHAVASAHIRAGNVGRAYELLRRPQLLQAAAGTTSSNSPKLRYLHGMCCFMMGKYDEAEVALAGKNWTRRTSPHLVPEGGAGLYLLGRTLEHLSDREAAVDCYLRCLEVCPFLWGAFERLSYLLPGPATASKSSTASASHVAAAANSVLSSCFADEQFARCVELKAPSFPSQPGGDLSTLAASAKYRACSPQSSDESEPAALQRKRRRAETGKKAGSSGSASSPPRDFHRRGASGGENSSSVARSNAPLGESERGLPTPMDEEHAPTTPIQTHLCKNPSPAVAATPGRDFLTSLSKLSPYRFFAASPVPRKYHQDGTTSRSPPRRERLRNNASPLTRLALSPRGFSGGFFRSQNSPSAAPSHSSSHDSRHLSECPLSMAGLLNCLGRALRKSFAYSSHEVLQILQQLPRRHQDVLVVQGMTGRCHLELGDYKKATAVYKSMCTSFVADHRLPVDLYSTALWHLGDKVELTHLGEQAMAWGRNWPFAWCAMGNSFSLQKEQEQALKCFRKAQQLGASYSYAYTLCGHELVACDQVQEAVSMYNQAIACDPKHYNAWWGLGNIYMRQQDYPKARYHFNRAVEINGRNSILLASLAQVCSKEGDPLRALDLFSAAAAFGESCNALVAFHKGCTLAGLGRHAEAVVCLQLARHQAPQEPCVHFELGRALAATGRRADALLHFNAAMELSDAKDIKAQKAIAAAQLELLGGSASLKSATSPSKAKAR